MKTAILKPTERYAANEAQESFAINIGPHSILDGALIANEANAGKGVWVQLSPFGKFPNKFDGRVEYQVVGKADAEAMVNDYKSVANSVKRIKGLPWYVGHPDHADFADKYADTGAKGRIKDLQCRHDDDCSDCASFANEEASNPCTKHGLFALTKFNDEGKVLIANESFDGHSVNWRLQRRADGWHPVHLKSVGFTNEANIPVPPVMAANQRPNMATQPTFIDRVRSLLKLKDSANEDEAYGAMESMCNEHASTATKHKQMVDQMGDLAKRFGANEVVDPTFASLKAEGIEVPAEGAIVFLANEVKTRVASGKTKDGEVTAANEKATKATERATAVELDLANERKAGATQLGELLITGGFLTKADHDALIKDKDFSKKVDFDAFMANAKTLKPKINTTSQVNLGGQNGDVSKKNNLQGELTTMANEIQSKKTAAGKRTNWDQCWAEACNSARGKEILLLMKKPEVQVEPKRK